VRGMEIPSKRFHKKFCPFSDKYIIIKGLFCDKGKAVGMCHHMHAFSLERLLQNYKKQRCSMITCVFLSTLSHKVFQHN
jgi:hypothetical protein